MEAQPVSPVVTVEGDTALIDLDDRYRVTVTWREQRAIRDGDWVVINVAHQWWLLDGSVPVAYLKTLFNTGDQARTGGCPLLLCDIEVRRGHRGQGHTRRIVATAEHLLGHPMWTSGGFTPLGEKALTWLPVCPGETPGVRYDDMAFVVDWDTMRAAYPL